ncbi:MAG: ATP-binding protein [Halofilum sp. (in: g-proteobacteria)]|nr:ATP-binding protein [Halofilum sp. (in: g-proteobacteria)]
MSTQHRKPRVDLDATRERLHRAGLAHAAERLSERLSEAASDELAPHAVLDRLLDDELGAREERRVRRPALRLSALPTGQTLENFDFAFQPAIERARIETLATGAWIRNAEETLLMQGPPGVGKSHLGVAGLGIAADRARLLGVTSAASTSCSTAHAAPMRICPRAAATGASTCPASLLLVIDEMGYDPMSREEASLFFRLVSYRYGRGAMIITTNKSIRDWTELLAGDEVLATAILDRLLHRAHVLNIKGRSYRLRDLEQAASLQR